jgi:hypothetical protein
MSSKKYISLPRHHLSYSQCSLWLSDKERYRAQYFDGRTDLNFSNSGQSYGKTVADALEAGRETGDLLTDAAMLLLPKYDVADQPIEVDVKTKRGWLNLIAKPDTFNSITKEFVEFKTGKGKNPWTPAKAQSHFQMWYYAVVIWQKYGVMLPDAKLAWIETEDTLEGIKPTGHVETFTVVFTPVELMQTLAKIVKIAHEIEEAWASHITKPYITTW